MRAGLIRAELVLAGLVLATLCVGLLAPHRALAEKGYWIKKHTLNVLEPETRWGTEAEHELAQAWQGLQDAIGPLKLELFSVAYGQLWSDTEVGGRDYDGRALVGWDTRFKANWRPWSDAQVFLQLQYNFGDKDLTPSGKGLLFTNINGIVGGLPEGKYTFHDLLFQQHFLDRRLYFAFGHTDPEHFIDENRFANSDHTQFASEIFEQEIGIDQVDENAPLFAAGFQPAENFEFLGVISSTTKSASLTGHKNLWTRPFWDGPFIGAQATFMPQLQKLEGNYRVFAWSTLYDQPRNDLPPGDEGQEHNWGVGFNFDQDITKDFGVFGRLGYVNQRVNAMCWDWSTGAQYIGAIPGRGEDIFGLAIGGVHASPSAAYGGMELHLESYYKVRFTEWLALTPLFMYTLQPKGDPDAISIVQGMLRLELDLGT